MAVYEKPKKAKECREYLMQIVEQYREEKEKIIPNSGLLKFTRGLLVRHIAVSINERASMKGLKDYIELRIFGKNGKKNCNDEVLSFFDREKNMEAFCKSIYCEDPNIMDTAKEEYGFPPFLLLEKAKTEMEKSFLEYYNAKQLMEERHMDGKGDDEYIYVSKKYVELMYSVATYEIFLREFYLKFYEKESYFFVESFRKDALDKMEKDKRIKNKCIEVNELIKQKKLEEIEELNELINLAIEFKEQQSKTYFYLNLLYYMISVQSHLYAMLRMVVITEFLNIHTNVAYGKDGTLFGEAMQWGKIYNGMLEELVEKEDKDKAFKYMLNGKLSFAIKGVPCENLKIAKNANGNNVDNSGIYDSLVKPKKNLSTLYQKFSNFYMANEKDKKMPEIKWDLTWDRQTTVIFVNLYIARMIEAVYIKNLTYEKKKDNKKKDDDFERYLSDLLEKVNKRMQTYAKREKYTKNFVIQDLEEIVFVFSGPIWYALDEIMKIQTKTEENNDQEKNDSSSQKNEEENL